MRPPTRMIVRMASLEALLNDAKSLPLGDRQQLVRELTRANLIELLREVERAPTELLPISEQELHQLVHEARRKVLRARGL